MLKSMAELAKKMDQAAEDMSDREGKYLTFTMAEVRGKVIPVVDLRLRFGMEKMEYKDRTCIIVVEIAGSTGTVQIGIVVDSVSEGLYIKGEDIEDTPTPTFGTKLNIDYIPGMAKMEGGVKIMIGIDKVLFNQELELVSAVKKEDSPVAAEASPEKTKEAESPSEKKVVSEASPEKTVAREAPPEQVHKKSKGDRDKQYFNKSSIYAFVLLTLLS
jgi:purine-binding chemotaxis protein CheW